MRRHDWIVTAGILGSCTCGDLHQQSTSRPPFFDGERTPPKRKAA